MQVLVVIRQRVKPMLGLAGRVLFKANRQEGPINPHRVRDAKSRNTTPISRKLGRQEWNKTPGKRPSLPPFTKYICALIKIRDIVISQDIHVPTWNKLQLHLQLATL